MCHFWTYDYKKLTLYVFTLCEHNYDQNGWLPPAYFVPSQFGKDAFLKEKLFLSKSSVSSSFKNFSTFQIFLIFSEKTLTNKMERHFQEITPFDTRLQNICQIKRI